LLGEDGFFWGGCNARSARKSTILVGALAQKLSKSVVQVGNIGAPLGWGEAKMLEAIWNAGSINKAYV
jgi:hypothetical protein